MPIPTISKGIQTAEQVTLGAGDTVNLYLNAAMGFNGHNMHHKILIHGGTTRLQASLNATDWMTLDAVTGEVAYVTGQLNDVPYPYVRVVNSGLATTMDIISFGSLVR